jgi:hypothetical protein
MAHLNLTADDIARLLVAEGATGWTVVTMGAICAAESGRDAYAVNVNHAPGSPPYRDPKTGKWVDGKPAEPWHRSLDVGLFQVNTFFNPVQKIAELLDPRYNTALALAILHDAGGPPTGYMRWKAYEKGTYRPYMPECRDAANRIGVKV